MSTAAAVKSDRHDIVVDEILPHAPDTIWKALTSGALMARWLMKPTGFEAVKGNRFTMQTTAAGAWDGTIHCEVLEVKSNERFVYAWKGGHAGNVGYGAPLDTIVTWTLSPVATGAGNGTRLRLVHSGFELPRNETAFTGMSQGWKKVVRTIDTIAGEGK
jgi:uncharacterized protein YndB with AHSA1/START domain